MHRNKKIIDRRGRIWTTSKIKLKNASEEDFIFWYEKLTPEERVNAVADALKNCLKTRGINVIPRLRRVHRRIECPWSKIFDNRGTRRRSLRSSTRY